MISHADTEKESFTVCKYIKERIHINEEYEDIYKSNVKPQLIRKMSVISRLRTQNVQPSFERNNSLPWSEGGEENQVHRWIKPTSGG